MLKLTFKGVTMNKSDFIKLVLSNVKTKKWLSGYYDVEIDNNVYTVGVKAYGLWVQILTVEGCYYKQDSGMYIKTQKVLNTWLSNNLDNMVLEALK